MTLRALFALLLLALPLGAEGLIAPSDPRLSSLGRIDERDPKAWRFDWSAVQLGFRFQGRDFALLLDDGGADFNVLVDGALRTVWRTRKGEERYEVSGLEDGEHRVLVQRRNEPSYGVTVFKGLELPRGGRLLAPDTARPERRLEFIGASWVCGYGNEGPSLKCNDLRAVQNAALAFPELTARALGAEQHSVAYSGRGVLRNYGEKATRSAEPFPALYGRSLQADPQSRWDFKRWVPHAVVVNLGGNDYSTEPHPETEEFIAAYEALLRRIRKAYPKALIVCFIAEGWPGYKPHVEAAVRRRVQAGDAQVHVLAYAGFKPEELGCDYHPKAWGHQRLADQLAPWLKDALGW